MPTPPEPTSPISPEEFQSLLAAAGLTISAEQAPQVLAELTQQRNHSRTIDAALVDEGPPGAVAFDPTFPKDADTSKDTAE